MALARKSIYPNDPERRDSILQKYASFVIPVSSTGFSLSRSEPFDYDAFLFAFF